MNQEAYTLAHDAVDRLVREHAIAVEKLTERQTVEAITQAILAGDFTRYVVAGSNAQQVVYAPFQEAERLRARVQDLEEELKEYRDTEDGE